MTKTHEHYEMLLMKGVDGVLTQGERKELEQHLSDCRQCQTEYSDFQAFKAATDSVRQRILQDAELEPIKARINTGPIEKLGFGLILVGTLTLAGWAGWDFFTDPHVPWWARWSTAAIASGALLVFGNILRKRLHRHHHDPYHKIDL